MVRVRMLALVALLAAGCAGRVTNTAPSLGSMKGPIPLVLTNAATVAACDVEIARGFISQQVPPTYLVCNPAGAPLSRHSSGRGSCHSACLEPGQSLHFSIAAGQYEVSALAEHTRMYSPRLRIDGPTELVIGAEADGDLGTSPSGMRRVAVVVPRWTAAAAAPQPEEGCTPDGVPQVAGRPRAAASNLAQIS